LFRRKGVTISPRPNTWSIAARCWCCCCLVAGRDRLVLSIILLFFRRDALCVYVRVRVWGGLYRREGGRLPQGREKEAPPPALEVRNAEEYETKNAQVYCAFFFFFATHLLPVAGVCVCVCVFTAVRQEVALSLWRAW
jgi:hypothetical protein